MTAPSNVSEAADPLQRRKPTRGQRVVAFAFLGAFGATLLTVLLTGLYVRSPSSRRSVETPTVVLAIDEPHTINLVFAARTPVDEVELTVDLPAGIELETHPGETRVVSHTRLSAGDNALPLTLVAREGLGGQLAAQLRTGEDRKTFVVDVTIERR